MPCEHFGQQPKVLIAIHIQPFGYRNASYALEAL